MLKTARQQVRLQASGFRIPDSGFRHLKGYHRCFAAIAIILAASFQVPAAIGQVEAPALSERTAPPRLDQVKTFLRLPLVPQAASHTCGVAALRSVLLYYGEDYGERELARILKADPVKGTGYQALLKFANRRFADPEKRDFRMRKRTGMTIGDLKAQIDAGRPVIVLMQAWAKPGTDWKREWDEGHYAVVVGYDEENLYFMDPAVSGRYAFLSAGEFLERWHDRDDFTRERLIHFGLVIENPRKKPVYDGNTLVKIQ